MDVQKKSFSRADVHAYQMMLDSILYLFTFLIPPISVRQINSDKFQISYMT